jgi:hypothetical protein
MAEGGYVWAAVVNPHCPSVVADGCLQPSGDPEACLIGNLNAAELGSGRIAMLQMIESTDSS